MNEDQKSSIRRLRQAYSAYFEHGDVFAMYAPIGLSTNKEYGIVVGVQSNKNLEKRLEKVLPTTWDDLKIVIRSYGKIVAHG